MLRSGQMIAQKEEEECYTEKDPFLSPPTDESITVDPRGLGWLFYDKMTEFSNNTAQIDGETGESITHGEVLLRAIRCAQHLQERGVSKEDIVLLCTYNHMNSVVPFLACVLLGVRVCSLDPTLSKSVTTHLLKLVTPKFIFCTPESERMLENLIAEAELKDIEIIVFGHSERNTHFSEFLEETGSENEFQPTTVDDIFDTAVIFLSSGTTGLPKGICTSHYGLIYLQSSTSPTEVVYLFNSTLYWISGVILLIISILNGGCRVFAKKIDEFSCMKIVEKYKVMCMVQSPYPTFKLIQNPETCNYDTSSLKLMVVAGAPFGTTQREELKKLLPYTQISNTYGLTETTGTGTRFNVFTDQDLIESKPGSCGKPVPGMCYKVVDLDTEKVLGPNQCGEIRIKGKCLMTGYHNMPELSKKAWDSEGYLLTGDFGYYDEDYCFYILDRIRDLLKYQSWKVVPSEIESVILQHPAVESTVVVGIPDEVDGDLPMGVVVLKSNVTATEEEIVKFVNERVSERKKIRAGIKFIDFIPLTPSMKLRRQDIRNWIIEGKI